MIFPVPYGIKPNQGISRYIKLNQTNYFFLSASVLDPMPPKKIEKRLPGQELANPPSVCVFSVLVGILEFCNRLWDFGFPTLPLLPKSGFSFSIILQ
jgi:hypothetical protein